VNQLSGSDEVGFPKTPLEAPEKPSSSAQEMDQVSGFFHDFSCENWINIKEFTTIFLWIPWSAVCSTRGFYKHKGQPVMIPSGYV
jgi:hypothetical protein